MTKNDIDLDKLVNNTYEVPKERFDNGRFTKTSLFLLPAIEINMYNPMIKPFFINAFMDDKDYKHDFTRPIFVLFKTKDFSDPKWEKTYDILRAKSEYILDYDCGIKDNNHLVMVVFQCRPEFKDDYYHFKRGSYSKFSKEYKSKFFKTVPDENGVHKNSIAYGAMFKENWLKDDIAKNLMLSRPYVDEFPEIWDLPHKEKEYFNYKEDENSKTDNKKEYSESDLPFVC